MGFKINTSLFGDWGGVSSALRWLHTGLDASIRKAVASEAEFITKKIKDNLKTGGSPSFKPISPFTVAVRRAMGTSSRKPGVATKQVLNAITATKVGKNAYFAGVLRGNDAHLSGRGTVQDVADVAMRLETGRPRFYLELDRPGRSGKTPRQWLWWLYLSGAITTAPGTNATHLQISEALPRPFVGQVADAEMAKIPVRISKDIELHFVSFMGSI